MDSRRKTDIIVCIGSGGVGKTTLSASLGILAAKLGLRVLVLTIDPSLRLASALGISNQNGEIERVKGQNYKGELFASVVNAKRVFDEFIEKATIKSGTAKKIMGNRLYQQLATGLSGSQEFTSLEKLYSAYESGEYQLIILDTPPAKHAMDFLEAPQRLSQIFTDVVARWFRDPSAKNSSLLSRVIGSSTRQVLKILETLTGSQFIKELSNFFENIEEWREELQKRTVEMHRLLVEETTQFFLVTSFDSAKLKEAENIIRDIRIGGYHLSAVFLNRAFPLWMTPELRNQKKIDDQIRSPDLRELYDEMISYYLNQEEFYKNFTTRLDQQTKLFKVPQFEEDIGDMKGLEKVADLIGGIEGCGELFSK